MRKVTVSSVVAILIAIALTQPASAATECKGLEEGTCKANAVCKWVPERKVGDTTKAGTPAKTAQKAHCRKGTTPSQSKTKPKKAAEAA
jgi:hypothetical protein